MSFGITELIGSRGKYFVIIPRLSSYAAAADTNFGAERDTIRGWLEINGANGQNIKLISNWDVENMSLCWEIILPSFSLATAFYLRFG